MLQIDHSNDKTKISNLVRFTFFYNPPSSEMLLSLFFSLSSCRWWKYNPEEYKDLEQQSIKRPLFVVCTLPSCPHCKGLPTLLREFSEMLGDKSKIVFSSLSCVNNDLCNKIGVRGVPVFVFIRGSDPKYWVRTYERGFAGWTKFLSEQTKLKITEIKDEIQLEQLILKTEEGGSTFHINVPAKMKGTVMKTYANAASFYGLMGCTFTYNSNENISKLEITAYHSLKCKITKTINESEIGSFIEDHKFSTYHHFDSGEIKDVIESKRNLLISMTVDPIPYEQKNALEDISGKYCDSMLFGYADMDEDQDILHFTGKTEDSNQFFFIINPKKKCLTISSKELKENDYEDVVNRSFNGINCMRIPKIRTNRLRKLTKKNGIMFLCGVGVLLLVYFIYVILSDNPNKIE